MPLIEPEFMALTEDLHVEPFWEENALCQGFTLDKPRCSLSFSPDDHWIFEFADVKSTLRYYQDKAYRDELHKKVNAITQEYVGAASSTRTRGSTSHIASRTSSAAFSRTTKAAHRGSHR